MFKVYFSKNKTVLKSLLQAFLPLSTQNSIQEVEILKDNQLERTIDLYQAGMNFETAQSKDKSGTKEKATSQSNQNDLSITDSSIYPSLVKNKQIVLDLKLKLQSGEKVNVEMQSVSKKGFLQRVLFYWARLYTEELKKTEGYHKLCPTYSLIFTNFNVLKEAKDFLTSFSVRSDQVPYFILNNHLKIIIVELSKFRKGELGELFDLRDLWCYILKGSGKISERECELLSGKGAEMKEAMDHLKDLSQDEELRREEEAREKFIRDRRAEIDFGFDEGFHKGISLGRKEGMDKGRKEGMDKGRKEGMDEGISLGISRGRKEGMDEGISLGRKAGIDEGRKEGIDKTRHELIMSMIKNQMPDELISKVTGLSIEEINKIKPRP